MIHQFIIHHTHIVLLYSPMNYFFAGRLLIGDYNLQSISGLRKNRLVHETTQLQTCFHCSILGLKQTIDRTRPAQLSMNKLTTEYWNSYTIWNKYFVIQNFKILGIKTKLKKHNK